MASRKNILLVLILSAAVSLSNLSADESPVEFDSWAESRQVISFTNDYPQYLILESGSLSGLPERAFLPWTKQLRVAGFAVSDGGVVIAVNSGYPLVLDGTGRPMLSSAGRRSDSFFLESTAGLTTGTVFSENGRAYFHFYRDDFFNTKDSSEETPSVHPVLLEMSRDASGEYIFSSYDYDFHKQNPEWEPVEYLRKDGESLIAWKYSDDKKTRFRYIRHGAAGESIAEIDEGFFRDEYSLLSMEGGSFALRGFIRAARDGSAGAELSDAGDIYLRLSAVPEGVSGAGYPLYYHSPAGKRSSGSAPGLPLQLQACADGDLWYILSGNEILVCGSNISRLKLPELPEGFVYEQLWAGGSDLIIGWEERRFPFIGRSGMMYIRMRDIIN